MGKTKYLATLSEHLELTPTVRELVIDFDEPESMSFQAGQFICIDVPSGDKPVKRAYSIASCDKDSNRIHLIFKLVPGGIASEYVKTLKPGASMNITGPFGRLFFMEPPTEQVLFLCTGAGISQHYSYLTSVASKYPEKKFHMLFGVWNEDEIFYEEKLNKIKNELPNFNFEYVLDHKLRDWSGKMGFVIQHIEDFNYMKTPTTFYLCGNPAMIRSMKAILSEQDFPQENIIAEAFN